MTNYIKEENDEDFGENSSNFIDESNEIKSEDKSSINNSLINDFKEKQVENMKFVSSRDKISNEEKNNENIISDIKNTEKSKNKIDMGEMIFYDLGQKDKKRNRYSLMGKEKMLTISKNFSSTPAKDLVQAGFYKTKFWDKNSENIKKYFIDGYRSRK